MHAQGGVANAPMVNYNALSPRRNATIAALLRSIYRLALRIRLKLRLHDLDSVRNENVDGTRIIVLPTVFNGVLLRTGAFLATALTEELIPRGGLVLDLGTGSGINAVFAARLGARVIATDTNPEAARCAQVNALIHHLEDRIEARVGDLFDTVQGVKFDAILFNPPYFIGRPRDVADYGWRSLDTFERFLRELPSHLKTGGRALIVLSTDGDINSALNGVNGLKVHVLRRRDFINETLTVYAVECSEEPE